MNVPSSCLLRPFAWVFILISAPSLAATAAICLSNTLRSSTYPASGKSIWSSLSQISVPSGATNLTPLISLVTQCGSISRSNLSKIFFETPSAHLLGNPISDFLSIIITFTPSLAANLAAEEPAGPAPITNTSVLIIIIFPKT